MITLKSKRQYIWNFLTCHFCFVNTDYKKFVFLWPAYNESFFLSAHEFRQRMTWVTWKLLASVCIRSHGPLIKRFVISLTTQKMKFSIKDFFSKCDQIRRKLRIWSHLLKKPFMEKFIFCAVTTPWRPEFPMLM